MRKRMAVLLAVCALFAALASVPSRALAQDYPRNPVRIIVPFSPGGPGDLTARFVGQELQNVLGQSFIVDNRPGANGVIAAGVAAKMPADGYTLLQISSSHTVNESLRDNKPYDLMRDFEAVASLNYTEMVLIAKNDLPANSVRELIQLAKAKPDALSYASSGSGSSYHMAGELLKSMAGISIKHVPYKEAAVARSNVLGGHIDLMFDALPAAIELVRAGKVKALATTAKVRSSALPQVPTVAEAGVPGFENTIFIGLMAPKNTPAPILDKLHREINKILSKPASQQFWQKQGAVPMVTSREEFVRFLKADIAQGAHLVAISGAKVE
jgi:tripartite-type tricarboxylate transporter receptor subunit TctC